MTDATVGVLRRVNPAQTKNSLQVAGKYCNGISVPGSSWKAQRTLATERSFIHGDGAALCQGSLAPQRTGAACSLRAAGVWEGLLAGFGALGSSRRREREGCGIAHPLEVLVLRLKRLLSASTRGCRVSSQEERRVVCSLCLV